MTSCAAIGMGISTGDFEEALMALVVMTPLLLSVTA
jgi:hypothetical protein